QFQSVPALFIAVMGDAARIAAFQMMTQLQKQGIRVELDYESKSLKSQMRRADKLAARYSLVLGDDELVSNTIQLKRMDDGSQQSLRFDATTIADALTGGAGL
ncbi:MAG: His/Gly/Thr/Pro-type tRNA ligase C-terminal domain-containing protein, partial [Trichlorobacter sp.]